MNRSEEIRQFNKLSVQEVIRKAGAHLRVLKNNDDLHQHIAEHMIETIQDYNHIGKTTSMIVPFGPVGQYPYFIEKVNSLKISLSNTHFFFMDEYADINGIELPQSHHLAFRGKAYEMFEGIDKELLPDYSKIIFPSNSNIYNLKGIIENIDLRVTYGGIGIHGHLAFNEPEKGVRNTDPRVVELNDYTVTINAIREGIGGNLENFPRKALTLGMNQLFSAGSMVFCCRNDIQSIDWANTVLRLALFGKPGDDYPVTFIKEHNDWLIVTTEDTIKTPVVI